MIKSLFYKDIIRRNKITPFIIFSFSVLSFSSARIIVVLFPKLNLFIKEYHIHHFYYGIALLLISNWFALVSDNRKLKNISAGIMGVGAGLIIDEAGLLLTCASPSFVCNYWSRSTYDALVWFGGLLLSIIYIGPILRLLKNRLLDFHKLIKIIKIKLENLKLNHSKKSKNNDQID